MNTENSKTNKAHRFKLHLAEKIYSKNPNKNITIVNFSIYYAGKKIKNVYNNRKFEISALTWNEFELPDGSYSVADVQDNFQYIIKRHETLTTNCPLKINVNKIKACVNSIFLKKTKVT